MHVMFTALLLNWSIGVMNVLHVYNHNKSVGIHFTPALATLEFEFVVQQHPSCMHQTMKQEH